MKAAPGGEGAEGTEALIARPAVCLTCEGRGWVVACACELCRYLAAVGGPPLTWYLPSGLTGSCFPCGHAITAGAVATGEVVCPKCAGSGQTLARKTAGEWQRLDNAEARRNKREASQAALLLRQSAGSRGLYKELSRRTLRTILRLLTPRCEARCTRTGKPCRRVVILGKERCKWHGGCSTGPKTAEGRARIGESNRRRAGGRAKGC